MTAMPRCEAGKKGRHNLMAFFHETDPDVPVTVICCNCGESKQYSMRALAPMDDLPADAIAELAKGTDPSRG